MLYSFTDEKEGIGLGWYRSLQYQRSGSRQNPEAVSISFFPDSVRENGRGRRLAMKIYTDNPEGSTVIQNSFIDQYMPHANGEFVKVYLYLLRCANSGRELSLSSIADVFEHTEKDVQRALTYWERQNLLRLKLSADGTLESVTFLDPGYYSTPVILADALQETSDLYSDGMTSYCDPCRSDKREEHAKWPQQAAVGAAGQRPELSTDQDDSGKGQEEAGVHAQETVKPDESSQEASPMLSQLEPSAQEDIRELYFVAEQYLKRPLSSTEQQDFVYYYHTLGFSTDLLEYLLEYCIMRGSFSRFYMRKVAQGWAEAGVTTVQEAKKESSIYNKNYYAVMKEFGLKGRNPAPQEQESIDRWLREYGFDLELILEACRRTIRQIHEPNFQYADKILTEWHTAGVHSMKEVEAADTKWEQEQSVKKNARNSAQKTGHSAGAGRFNNFSQREYNYDNLEKKLFGQP
ncbi:MAG: DnaD domain protein [Lachnospiraceae bacterium]|nr:DnaD domain protein [Lachnospiraceae bacterium]